MAVKHVSRVPPRSRPCERTRKTSAVFAVKSKMGARPCPRLVIIPITKCRTTIVTLYQLRAQSRERLTDRKSPTHASGDLNSYSAGSRHDGLLFRFCSSLNYFILSTISFAQPAARSTSPSFSGPSVPSTKNPSGDAMRAPPFLFRLPAIFPAA